MADSNGSLKANGATHANGINGKLNGQTIGRRRMEKPKQGFLSWMFGLVARLATWAAILTVLFRCPNSLETCDENAPYICKPYFQVKNAVAPVVWPYYEQYASPYVEVARPYYEVVDSKVLTPTRAYAVQYGAPWVERGREQAWTHWEKSGQPQLAKAQQLAQTQYEQSVGPYVVKASEAVGPYYEIARTNSLQVFYEYVVPTYDFVYPYVAQGYDVASDFTTTTALPTAYWAWNKTYVFLDTSVWPHLRVVYSENVEPQLLRIGERLGRYRTQEKTKTGLGNVPAGSVTEAAYSSFSKPPPQSPSSLSSSTTTQQRVATESPEPESPPPIVPDAAPPVDEDADDYIHPVQAPPAGPNESEQRRKAREMVAQDLHQWQTKFAKQADEGASDMEDRVDDIAKRMIRRNARVTGKKLLQELQSTIETEMKALKAEIITFVQPTTDAPAAAEDQVIKAIRSSGMAIKKKAQAIREWRESFDQELHSTVLSIADVHFQILDETRNLALQHIGMRWAWTDGVTYKDWAKYHELKSTLREWTEQLKQLIVTHPTLLEAQDASAQVEDEGMEIASAAAQELGRLKQVAHWKIVAGDATDNFDSEAMKKAAEAVEATRAQEAAARAQALKELEDAATASADVEEAVVEDTNAPAAEAEESVLTATEDITSTVTEFLEEVTSSAVSSAEEVVDELEDFLSSVTETAHATEESSEATSESLVDSSAGSLKGAAQAASSSASSVYSDASSVASKGIDDLDSVMEQISSTVEVLSSDASESASSLSDEVYETVSSAVDAGTESIRSFASVASESVLGTAEAVFENPHDEIYEDEEELPVVEEDPMTEREETPVSATPEVKPAFLGAAAQAVSDRQPILDDYVDTDVVASATDGAQAAYSKAMAMASEQYSSAVSVVSAQIYGTPKPVHEQLFSSVSTAYDNAIAAASSKLSEAMEAASSATPATPTMPTLVDWERVESIAAQRLNEGRLWAEIQYQSAMIALGLATPTPSSTMEKYYEQAKMNYYAGLGLAQDRYASFMAGASSALSSLTATPTPTDFVGSASSMASVARESAASAAHAAGDAAGSVYSAAGDTIASAAKAVDDSVSSVVDAANEQISSAGEVIADTIADTWVNVVDKISGQVYGQPTRIAWYEHVFSDAGSYAASATDAAEKSVETASAEASKQYSAVSELVSELIVGKEPSFTESVLMRLQAAYATAAASVESFASEASEAASSVGDKVGSAASQATEAVKETVQHLKDEL